MRNVRALGSTVPAMINAYMNLSPTMRSFGTAMNHEFGETDETGIMVSLRDLVPEKRKRYIESYDKKNRVLDRLRLFRINMKEQPWWKQIKDSERTELRRLKHLKEVSEKAKNETSSTRHRKRKRDTEK